MVWVALVGLSTLSLMAHASGPVAVPSAGPQKAPATHATPTAPNAPTLPAKPLKSYPSRNDGDAYRISIALDGHLIGQIRSQVPPGAETAEVAQRTVKGKPVVEVFAHFEAIPDDEREGAMLIRIQGGANAIGPSNHPVTLSFRDIVLVMPQDTTLLHFQSDDTSGGLLVTLTRGPFKDAP